MSSKMEDFGFLLSRTFATTRKIKRKWPYVPGKYFVHDPAAPVAVTTLGSVALAKEVSDAAPAGLAIVGKVETENIGIEKIMRNLLSNPAIRFLICSGAEPPKHLTGATIVALFANGVDGKKRIIGSPAMRPQLPNASPEEIKAFRETVIPIDMIGCTDVADICARVSELARTAPASGPRPLPAGEAGTAPLVPRDDVETVAVETVAAFGPDPRRIKMDKGGYFVIHVEDDKLTVEHYDYKETLLRVIEGDDARSIYFTLIDNGWVTRLDHAAYLGKELMRAELCRRHGIDFTQDGA